MIKKYYFSLLVFLIFLNSCIGTIQNNSENINQINENPNQRQSTAEKNAVNDKFVPPNFKPQNDIEEKYVKEILIEIYLLGGAFFVINKLRKLSPDIDILVQGSTSYRILNEVGHKVAKNYSISLDIFSEGMLGEKKLPSNFLKSAKIYRRVKTKFKHIKLLTLSPYDILISKISRGLEKDKIDINYIMTSNKFKIRRKILETHIRGFRFGPEYERFNKNLIEFYKIYEKNLHKTYWERLTSK